MYDLFSIVSGFICALYLIIPLVLGVFYILYSFKEKALSKANLITKSILHSIKAVTGKRMIDILSEAIADKYLEYK